MSQTWLFVLTFVPLVIYVIVDFYSGLKSGVLAAIGSAAVTALAFWWLLGELDWESIFIVGVMAVTGIISIKKNNPIFFKFQPVITGSAVILYLSWLQFWGVPFFIKALPKLLPLLPEYQREIYDSPEGNLLLADLNLYVIIAYLIHTSLLAWVAAKASNKVWIIVKGLGIPFIMFGTLIGFFLRSFLQS